MNEFDPPAIPNEGQVGFTSLDSVLICIDVPGDKTVQPRPPNIPRGWPPQARHRPLPSSEPPVDQS